MRKTDEILRTLLHQKGLDTQEVISEFLSDRPQKTYDPFLLYNMEAGVDLLLSEIKKNTKICIYGDYDADGVTSVCILSSVLSHLTSNFIHYIPSRVEEGYGLNKNAVRKLADQGVGLIVTVDCGSVSCEEADLARELGIKMIVTDHHSIDGKKRTASSSIPSSRRITIHLTALQDAAWPSSCARHCRSGRDFPRAFSTKCWICWRWERSQM